MLHTEFQAPEPSGSEEDFLNIFFYVFLLVKPKTSWHGAMLDPRSTIGINLVRDESFIIRWGLGTFSVCGGGNFLESTWGRK